MVKIGQKVRFDPFKETTGFSSLMHKGKEVTGTVIYVNELHGWFTVEYGELKLPMSFQYSQIGTDVYFVNN